LNLFVAIYILHPGIKWLKAGRQKYRPDFNIHLLRCLQKINGVGLAYALANTAFLLFEVNTAVINIGDKGNCLREVYVDGFILRYFLIIFIWIFDRAVLHAGRTPRASILYNVAGLLGQGDIKVSRLPFDPVNFSISQNLYIWMPADLDQFG